MSFLKDGEPAGPGFEKVAREIEAEAPQAVAPPPAEGPGAPGQEVPEFEVLPPEQPKHTPESLRRSLKGLFTLGAIGAAAAGYGFDPDCVTEKQWEELVSERATRLANKWGDKLAQASEFYAKWEDELWFAGESLVVVTTMGRAIYKSMRELREQEQKEAQQHQQAQREAQRVHQDNPPGQAGAPAPTSAPATETPAPTSPASSAILVRPEPARPFTPSGAWQTPAAPSSSTPRGT